MDVFSEKTIKGIFNSKAGSVASLVASTAAALGTGAMAVDMGLKGDWGPAVMAFGGVMFSLGFVGDSIRNVRSAFQKKPGQPGP